MLDAGIQGADGLLVSGDGAGLGPDQPGADASRAGPVADPGTCAVQQRTTISNSGGTAAFPSIVWAENSYLVAWSDGRTGSVDVYVTRLNPDGSRYAGATEKLAAHTGNVTTSARSSPLGNGRYLLVWEDCRPSLPDCVNGTSVSALLIDRAGSPQGSVANLTGVAQVQRRPYLVSALGGAYATFRDVVNQVTVAQVVRFDADGSLASDAITLGSESMGQYPYIAAGNGELAAVFTQGMDASDIVLTRLSASLSPLATLVVRSGSSAATNPVAQWNGTGWVVAWEDTASGDVLVQTALAAADASSVGPMHPLQNSNGNWPAVAFDGQNTEAAFYGFPNGAQIMLARLDGSANTVGSVIQISDNTGKGKYPSVASSDVTGDFGVVWADEQKGEIVFAEVGCR